MVSNEVYEKALKNNDNLMIMHSAGSCFMTTLDVDEIYRCKLMALWEALKSWNPRRGRKFTAFLYQRVRWECLKSIQIKNKNRGVQIENLEKVAPNETPMCELLDGLPLELQDIVHKRYVYSMTLREIGDEYGYCYETIRNRLKQASKYMHTNLAN